MCMKCCIIPLGGVISLFAAIAGFIYLNRGFTQLLGSVKDMGGNLDEYNIETFFGYIGYAVVVADLFVVLYGLREKMRTRLNMLGHMEVTGCTGCCFKFTLKSLIYLVVVGSLVLSSVLTLLLEGIYVLFLSIDQSCDTGRDSVKDILDVVSSKSGSVDEICDAVDEGQAGAFNAFVGSVIVTAAQVLALSYWMKYSTLAMVPAFYTTGEYGADGEDLEMSNGRTKTPLGTPNYNASAHKTGSADRPTKAKAPRKL